jgi:hypothetical protein
MAKSHLGKIRPPGPSLSLLSLPGGFGKKKNIAIYLKKFNV